MIANILLYVPIVLSLAVLAAHFLRYDHAIGVIGSLVLIALLFLRQPWVARLVQVALVLGALEWVRTLFSLMQVVTLVSALLFQTRALKAVYRLDLH